MRESGTLAEFSGHARQGPPRTTEKVLAAHMGEHVFVGPAPRETKPSGQTHCNAAPAPIAEKFALHVHEAGPPEAVDPSGQAEQPNMGGAPVMK